MLNIPVQKNENKFLCRDSGEHVDTLTVDDVGDIGFNEVTSCQTIWASVYVYSRINPHIDFAWLRPETLYMCKFLLDRIRFRIDYLIYT